MTLQIRALDPRSGGLGPPVQETSPAEVESLVATASAAASDSRLADTGRREALLRGISGRLAGAQPEIVEIASGETGLSEARLTGELARTCDQLEMFADVIVAGDHLDVMIDTADPAATPTPRPDLRRMMLPLGPVVVFGASNFPLAFSTAGGDTASALAAGCPVIVKAHPAHPQTGRLVAAVVSAAVDDAGLPAGTFGHAVGAGNAVGERLVDDPRVEAVGFTGSEAGGRALAARAAARPRPIPVFAEMGSLNPIVITERALRARGTTIAEGLAGSVAGSGGQLCTKPGLVFLPAGADGDDFCRALVSALAGHGPHTLLTESVANRLRAGLHAIEQVSGIEVLTTSTRLPDAGLHAAPVACRGDIALLATRPELQHELFGPAVVVLTYAAEQDLLAGVDRLAGQLTATIHAEPDDVPALHPLLELCARRVGRVVFNGYPTGLSPGWALQHGGPFPASTNAAATSVGATAIRRFLRPITFQNLPNALQPRALQDTNPLGLVRRINGVVELPSQKPPHPRSNQ